MLIISREAPVKIGKHAWNVFPLEAFGYLLGSKNKIHAALPCSKTKRWYEYDDRWTGILDHLDKARAVGKVFHLDVVGFYGSTESLTLKKYSTPPSFITDSSHYLMFYITICCQQCSDFSIIKDGQILTEKENFIVHHGKRISKSINQKRILKEWIRMHGPIDYSNQSPI